MIPTEEGARPSVCPWLLVGRFRPRERCGGQGYGWAAPDFRPAVPTTVVRRTGFGMCAAVLLRRHLSPDGISTG